MKNYFLVLLILPFLSVSITSCKDETVRNKKKDKDLQQLNVLFQEIETMANQVTCENAADWKFIFVGSGRCGDTKSSYVAYSTKIDHALFLQKIHVYNEKQKLYSEKWETDITCLAVSMAEPKSVTCVDGKPKFLY